MIHSILAAFLVTAAMVSLSIEVWKSDSAPGKAFSWLYLFGTTFWGVVAIFTHSITLIFVSAIQFSCCLFLAFYSSREN